MRILAFLLAVAFVASAPFAAAQPSCPRCDQWLDLNESQWNCLLQRLPRMQSASTETVFFSLSPQVCSTSQATRAVVIPGANGGPESRVYRLTRDQVACLARKAPAKPRAGRVVFNFAMECGVAPPAAQNYPQSYSPPPAPANLQAPAVEEAASPYEAYRRMQGSQ